MMVAALGLEAIAMGEVMSLGDSDNDGMVVERRCGARKMCTEMGQRGF